MSVQYSASTAQSALPRKVIRNHLSCTYLAHHQLESVLITIIIVHLIVHYYYYE